MRVYDDTFSGCTYRLTLASLPDRGRLVTQSLNVSKPLERFCVKDAIPQGMFADTTALPNVTCAHIPCKIEPSDNIHFSKIAP